MTVVAGASPAQADYIYCPPDNGPCYIVVTGGGSGGSGGGGGGGGDGTAKCRDETGEIPCYRDSMGWYNQAEGCYYDRLTLPPGDPAWGGHDPNKGSLYQKWCYDGGAAGYVNSGIVYLTSPPPGYGGLPSVLEIALRAINALPIAGPDIGLAPRPGGSGLVGLPVWMWTEQRPETWGTQSATASVPGLSVTARATSVRISWEMGDGSTKVCGNPGTPYTPAAGGSASRTCGYQYTEPSRDQRIPGHLGRYRVVGTTTWHVEWTATTGETGELDVTRSSTTYIRIDEMQVVTR
ncbi:MAG: hypothetical protein HOU81_15520 [Hamadaea sp.]|uniref:hypothetical protein n=1 Tax=Hamadaea sp. TaxID=2024425 RepID=UPI00178DB5BC|nr:hypothetical protein [Hamadaea sp.]NUR72222.1 hypothetical protein [Hamadaea sp.]NUT22115.1 hypothetical protein [Hamadaea sp.]